MWLQTLLWNLWKTCQPKKKQSCGRVLFLIKFAKQFLFKGCKRSALACIHLTAAFVLSARLVIAITWRSMES